MIIIRVWLVLFALLLGNMGWKCVGQDLPKVAPASVSFQARVERVEDNWEDLVGVAIRPGGTGERYEVFVLDGATGNLVRFYSDEPAKRANVITGIQLTESGSGEDRPPGGWAMAFLNRSHLLVMGGSLDGTQHVLKSFELPIDGQSMAAGEPHQEILSTPHRQPLGEGERSLFGIALDSERVYLCREGSQFAVAEASLQGNRLGDIGVWATAQPGDKPSGARLCDGQPAPRQELRRCGYSREKPAAKQARVLPSWHGTTAAQFGDSPTGGRRSCLRSRLGTTLRDRCGSHRPSAGRNLST